MFYIFLDHEKFDNAKNMLKGGTKYSKKIIWLNSIFHKQLCCEHKTLGYGL